MRLCTALAIALLPWTPLAAQAPDLQARARQVLAQLDGKVGLTELKEPVEVLRDRWGIAHIYAHNTADLFYAQGFVAAQDRLFQIEMWRRQAAGEMAEVVGASAVEADRFARLMRYRGDMDAEWKSYSPDTRAIATAFTRGINAYIALAKDRLPIEFQLLGFAPKPWLPEDVLGRMSGIYMSQNFRNEVMRARLVAALGIDKARRLAPVDPPRQYEAALSQAELQHIDQRVLAGYEAATKQLQFKPARTESNNWVVAGTRSLSGKPLLASDPHRAIALPSLRYLVHLHAPGWNVIGSGEPGLPGVAIGHNERIAWGFTIIGVDQADFYVEETNPADPRAYKVDERWEKMKVVRDEISVKGRKEPVSVELCYTRHGPVLHQDDKAHRAYALRWVGSEPGGGAYLGSLAVARAHDRRSFLEALGSWKIPGLNFVYADVDGDIGWIAAARTPVRAKHDGLLPVPGNARYEWQGFLPVAELPQSFNPAAGFVATANHNIVPKDYRHTIGFEFAAPYRFHRLHDALAAAKKWQLDDFRALQYDDVSLPGLALGRLLRQVSFEDPALDAHARLLRDWDGRLSIDSRAGPLYACWLKELQDALCARAVAKELRPALTTLAGLPVMLAAVENADPLWFGSAAGKARDELVRTTFRQAVKRLDGLPEAARQSWGTLHTVTFHHPVSKAFDLGPLPRPGDANTPHNARHDDNFKQVHGATYRHLFDLADWDRGLATSAPGQSGQPGSPHYGDLAPLWANGEYFPLAYSRSKVEEVTRHRLTLRPLTK
jgi:penicillin amidase